MLMLVITSTTQAHVTKIPRRCTSKIAPRLCAIHWHRHRTNVMRHKMNLRPIPYHWIAEKHPGRRDRIMRYWMRVQAHASKRLRNYHPPVPQGSYSSPKYTGLICIHTHEGAWNANTGNGYYGGLQMDSSFQQTYGPEFYRRYGTANNWPVIDQLIAGYRAVQSRGYGPWPNTARMCGLL